MWQKLKNTNTSYGWLSIIFHWLCALFVIGLFCLGLYMVELTYYDSWYHDSFHWHESLGMIFTGLLLLRMIWRQLNPKPLPLGAKGIQQSLARLAHRILYWLMLLIPISGYLISTADGHELAVFNWLNIPSITGDVSNMETISGQFHYWLSIMLIVLVIGHILAALKHHFIDKDATFRRMIKPE